MDIVPVPVEVLLKQKRVLYTSQHTTIMKLVRYGVNA